MIGGREEPTMKILITVGSSHEPIVIYHCRFKPGVSNDTQTITVGWWL
jgi:hypothetical protein